MATDPRLTRAAPRNATPSQRPPPPPPVKSMPQQNSTPAYDGVEDEDGSDVPRQDEGGFKLKFCTVCASNQNRYVIFSPQNQMDYPYDQHRYKISIKFPKY